MFKNCHSRLRLVLRHSVKRGGWPGLERLREDPERSSLRLSGHGRSTHVSWCVKALVPFLVWCSACAGADDDVDENAPKVAQPLVRQRAIAGTLLNQTLAQESLNNQLRYKVDEFRANYDLSKAQQAKLALAGHADVRRASDEVQQIFHGPKFREIQRNLFGPESFMAKAIPRILTAEQTSKYRAPMWMND